ncbi:MAG: response regulator [Bacteroidales bacterium]|nr:response regulator [Bacteroidales bacterium]
MEKINFNILYVDDEEQNLFSFRATFRREYNIFTAISGKEGMEIMHNNDIHLIITDQRMPEMTGIQFLEKILPVYPDPIRMILTGFSDVEAIVEAINTGRVFRYITKPWDERELRMTIENARQLYGLQRKNKSLVSQLQQKVEEQEKTLRLFMKYVPEPVVQKTLSQKDDSILEGESREVAVLFCDIRGFTPMSEQLSPKEVVGFLNDYYGLMSRIIKRHNGSVTQFVGDEIFATFGAPLAQDNNEEQAVYAAIEMIEVLPELNKKYKDRFKTEIQVGIGINFGEVVMGNVGSEDRIEFAITGDTVNTGKRIEMLTKETPNLILVRDRVFEKTKSLIEAREWEPVNVKGKRDKITVFEVIRRKEA